MTIDLGAIALSMLRVENWGNAINFVRAGWNVAEQVKPLMGVRFEEGLDKPLDVWRKELDIEPVLHGQNSWHEVLKGLEL